MINTITLCGSTRFLDSFNEANVELAKRGFSVFSISLAMPKGTYMTREGNFWAAMSEEEAPGLKDYLDLVHFNKILRSDAVFVVGNGYIGRSTAREILWAEMHGKPILWQFDYSNNWDEAAAAIRFAQPAAFSLPVIQSARKVLGL